MNVNFPNTNKEIVRAACKKCGYAGHLTYQCRNFLKVDPNKEILLDVSSTSSDSDEQYVTPLTKLRETEVKQNQRKRKQKTNSKHKIRKKKRDTTSESQTSSGSSSSDSDSDSSSCSTSSSSSDSSNSNMRKRKKNNRQLNDRKTKKNIIFTPKDRKLRN